MRDGDREWFGEEWPVGVRVDDAGAASRRTKLGAARTRVLVAEDEELLRTAIADLIDGEADLELLGTAADAEAALELARVLLPDVALLDLRMPGGGGVRAVLELRRVSPGTRAVALSAHDDRANVLSMLRAGAVGYLVKGAAPAEGCSEAVLARVLRDQASSLGRDGRRPSAPPTSRTTRRRAPSSTRALGKRDARFARMLESIPDAVAVVGGRRHDRLRER